MVHYIAQNENGGPGYYIFRDGTQVAWVYDQGYAGPEREYAHRKHDRDLALRMAEALERMNSHGVSE